MQQQNKTSYRVTYDESSLQTSCSKIAQHMNSKSVAITDKLSPRRTFIPGNVAYFPQNTKSNYHTAMKTAQAVINIPKR